MQRHRTDSTVPLDYASRLDSTRHAGALVRALGVYAAAYGPAYLLYLFVYKWTWIVQCWRSASDFDTWVNRLHCYWPGIHAAGQGIALPAFAVGGWIAWRHRRVTYLFHAGAAAVLLLNAASVLEDTGVSLAVSAGLIEVSYSGYWLGGLAGILLHGIAALCLAITLPGSAVLASSRRAATLETQAYVATPLAFLLILWGICQTAGLV